MRASWEALHAGLTRSVRSLPAHRAFLQAQPNHPALAGFGEPTAVVALLTSRDGDLDAKDQVLAALVTMAQRREHPALATALLWLGLWAGLDAVYRRRCRHFVHRPEELVSEIGDAFTRLIDRIDLASTIRVACTLVRSAERDLMEARKRAWAEERRASVELNDDTELPDSLQLGASGFSPDAEVAALRTWLEPVVGEDSELLIAVIVLEETQREAGERLGLSHEATRKRFQRSLGRIRRHVAEPLSQFGAATRV